MFTKAFLILSLAGLCGAAAAGPLYVASGEPASISEVDLRVFKLLGSSPSLPTGLSSTALYSNGPIFEGQGRRYVAESSGNHGLVRLVDPLSDSSTAQAEIPGTPLLLISTEDSVLVAAESGVLYRLNRNLTGSAETLFLGVTPKAFYYVPEPTPSPVPAAVAATPSPTPGFSISILRGVISGHLTDAISHEALTDLSATASISALNPRGKSYPGSVDATGAWSVSDLPWGDYSIVIEAPGYHKLLRRRVLLSTKQEILDLELTKE